MSLKAVTAVIALAVAGACMAAEGGTQSESSKTSQTPALTVDRAFLTGGGSMLQVHFTLPPPKSTQWLAVGEKDTYVADEATGEKFFVLNLVRIGPAAQVRLPKGGGPSYIVIDNRHEHLKPGARITVVIGALKQEHVTVTEQR
jgi:hypothetical protein